MLNNMMTYFQAIILGALQGITELFPISSLGHSVILPHLLGWNIDQHASFFLTFIVITHFATSLVLLGFFRDDWKHIISGILRSLRIRQIREQDTYAKLSWLIVISTIPAGILGLFFEEKLKILFASSRLVAWLLVFNGIMLYGAERLKQSRIAHVLHNDQRIARLSWAQAIKIGCLQSIALIPGFSRTGSTIAGGLIEHLSHEDAARYSFLLATPIIFAASILKIPELLTSSEQLPSLGIAIVGAITSALSAYFSIKFLIHYFKTKTLIPFALYCIIAGIASSIVFLFR